MTQPPKEQRVSYSALSDLDQCSMKFYMGRVLGLPQKIWSKTVMGSLLHVILECLALPRHRKDHDAIVVCIDPKDLTKRAVRHERSEALRRLVKRWTHKYQIGADMLADIDPMLEVALIHTNFFHTGAIKIYPPELEFIEVVNGARLKGVIDSMADYGDYILVRDWKSAGSKMTKKEVTNSFQSRMYQWYVRRKFGKRCVVEYVFLRFPPTKMTPQKHVMRVEPSTVEQETGFEYYASAMYPILNSFGAKEAYGVFCSDEGFCLRVCSYAKPFAYWDITKADGMPSRRIWIDPKNPLDSEAPILYDGETCQKLTSAGCPRYNPQ